MKKSKLARAFFAVVLLGASRISLATAQYLNLTISNIEADVGDGCIYFQLTGVTVADASIVAGNPNFAISTTLANAQQIYAMLLAARISGTPLARVVTTGTACGTAQAYIVDL